jgi:hypothetical protein
MLLIKARGERRAALSIPGAKRSRAESGRGSEHGAVGRRSCTSGIYRFLRSAVKKEI